MFMPEAGSERYKSKKHISTPHRNQMNEAAQMREMRRYLVDHEHIPLTGRRLPAVIQGIVHLLAGLGR